MENSLQKAILVPFIGNTTINSSTKRSILRTLETLSVLLLFITVQHMHAQDGTTIEALASDSYENLEISITQTEFERSERKRYAHAFLLKAKQENNLQKKVDGYYFLAALDSNFEHQKALTYLDSILELTVDKPKDPYPAKAYLLKGNIKGSITQYQEALDEFLIASKYADAFNNEEQQYRIKYFMALLKNNTGDNSGAMDLQKEVIEYYGKKSEEGTFFKLYYITSLYAYANSLNIVSKTDPSQLHLAEAMHKKAISELLRTKDSVFYDRLLLSTAFTHIQKKEYQKALDSVQKMQRLYANSEARISTIVSKHYLLGHIYMGLDQPELGIPNLKKVDSLAFARNHFFLGIPNNYRLLIDYYESQDDTRQQLFYIDRLLKMDSIMDSDTKYIATKLNKGYATPQLIREKQQIIDKLENQNRKKQFTIGSLSLVFSVSLVLLVWNYRKQRTYKRRFEELMATVTQTPKGVLDVVQMPQPHLKKDLEISDEIVEDILEKLATFEKNKGFLRMNISVGTLAKEFETNTKYFSKIINTHKNQSFTNYINALRIDHVLQQLTSDLKFRRYTIKAIANEIGFNTTEAFSKSFYKSTGLQPSYFIKQLEKQQVAS